MATTIAWLTTRRFSASSSSIEYLASNSQTHFIFGANTDVGKTVISAGLVRASGGTAHYIKPLQCGGSDQSFVKKHAPNVSSTTTLFEWESFASPHVASRKERKPISDQQVLSALTDALADLPSPSKIWIETAGGVLSPSCASPDNRTARHAHDDELSWGWVTQGDLYQPLQGVGPVVLVGDGRLGGISATLSSLESLLIRGYEVSGIVLLETGYANQRAIQEYATRKLKLRSGKGTALFENPEASIISLPGLPPEPEPLTDWYESQEVQQKLASFIEDHLNRSWQDRVENLQDMSSSTAIMWCPLPQYGQVKNGGKLTMVDMGHGESSMSLAVAAAAGRYGNIPNHPNIIHAPAIELSKSLMQKHGWAKRVLFSEDQGKAMAAAIVMGFELHQTRRKHQNVMQGHPRVKLTVLMQKESDNVRVIDNILWLKNRQHSTSAMNHNDTPGFLALEAPTLGFKDGVLQVSCSSFVQGKTLESIVQAMDVDRRLETTDLYKQYLDEITKVWNEYEGTPVRLDGDEKSSSPKRQIIASCVVEPILTSAVCGMTFVDPLWQRALVDVARSKNVPVIFDESASGMYRIGVASCREILKVDPDVAIHSTGGVLPMSVALATEEVYEAYSRNNSGEEYGDYFSLNNGAAPPMACVGAIHALESYDDASLFLFNEEQTRALSKLPLVQQSCSLGSVLALTINGNNAVSIAQELAINEGLHVRAIGDTITILASPLANADECARICDMLHHTIKQFGRENENVSL